MAGFGVQKLFGAILLSLLCIAGLPGTGEAVSPGKTQSQEPEIFRQLGAKVVSLKFYATEKNKLSNISDRVYKKYFLQDESHYIWYELHLDARAKRPGPVRLKAQATLYIPGEKPLTRVHLFTIPPEIRQVYLTGSCKGDMPEGGWWFPGSYRLTLTIDNQEVASGTFEVGMY